MEQLTCLCGTPYKLIPDEEITGIPPSYMARQFYCESCGVYEWLEPYDLGGLSWEDIENELPDEENYL